MTDWSHIRPVLRAAVASALGWNEALVRWQQEPRQVNDTEAILSIVSDVEQGERAPEVVPGPPVRVYTIQDFRAQVQVQIETSAGDVAIDHAKTCRTFFQHGSTRAALAAEGVAIVQECGPVRDASYEADDYAVSVASFEVPIRYQSRVEDARARPKPATKVGISGTAAGVPVVLQVDKPA